MVGGEEPGTDVVDAVDTVLCLGVRAVTVDGFSLASFSLASFSFTSFTSYDGQKA